MSARAVTTTTSAIRNSIGGVSVDISSEVRVVSVVEVVSSFVVELVEVGCCVVVLVVVVVDVLLAAVVVVDVVVDLLETGCCSAGYCVSSFAADSVRLTLNYPDPCTVIKL